MKRLLIPWLLTVGSACIFAPQLDKFGYSKCSGDGDCAELGRVCQSGYCSPPAWWDANYKSRRQVLLTNPDTVPLPKGFPLRIGVGPDPRPFKRDEFGATARLIAIDRGGGGQVEVPVTVDVLSTNAFDVLFLATSEIPPGGTLADLYVYSGAADGASARADARKQVFPLDDDFEALTLDAALWRTDGAVNIVDGDAVVLRTGYLWSNLGLPGVPGVQLTVEFQADSNCDGLAMGLVSNPQKGFRTPYIVATSSGPAQLSAQALRGDTLLFEPEAPMPFSITGSTQRLDLLVSGTTVAFSVDGTVVDTFLLNEALSPTDLLRAHFFVDGASCTLNIKKMRMRPALANEPTVSTALKVAKPD